MFSVLSAIGNTPLVTMIPDSGDRYISTTLFWSTCAKCPP
jgi:hypothetical protein